jgi:hypothetical protein
MGRITDIFLGILIIILTVFLGLVFVGAYVNMGVKGILPASVENMALRAYHMAFH